MDKDKGHHLIQVSYLNVCLDTLIKKFYHRPVSNEVRNQVDLYSRDMSYRYKIVIVH